MNMLAARVSADGSAAELAGGERLRLERPRTELGGREVTLGLRPEHVEVNLAHGATLAVELVEALGADTLVYGHLGTGGEMLTVRIPGVMPAKPGDKLRLNVPPERLHLFDKASGARI